MEIGEIKWKKPIQQLIKQDILGKSAMEFAAKTAEEIMRPFVPMDTGNLSNDIKKNSDGIFLMGTAIKNPVNIIAGETERNISGGKFLLAAIHYTAPYAKAVYYNKRGVTFRKTHHQLATSLWDKRAMEAGGKERLIRVIKAHIKQKRGGGI